MNPVHLSIYRDGIIVDLEGHAECLSVGNAQAAAARGAKTAVVRFRPYSDQATEAFMQDLLDGYFPSEFKARFPDGVEIKVRDESDLMYGQRGVRPAIRMVDFSPCKTR